MSWKNMQRSSSTNGPCCMAIVTVCPFASPEELPSSTAACKGRGNDIKAFKIVHSAKTSIHSHRRQMWSAKKEKLLSQGLIAEHSRAALSESLKHEDTSNWSGSLSSPPTPFKAFTEEDDEPYSLAVPLGRRVCQQLQRGNVVRVCSNRSWRDKEPPATTGIHAMEELAPLCFRDELQRTNAKIVTATAPCPSIPPPVVCETHPVLCSGEKYKHTLFGSSGFHTLTHRSHPPPARRTVHAAIVRITDSLEAEVVGKRRSGRGREGPLWTAGTWRRDVLTAATPTRPTTLRLLSADGSVTKDTAPGERSLSSKTQSTFPITDPPEARGAAEARCGHLTGPLTVSALPRGGSGSQVLGRWQIGLPPPDRGPQLVLSPEERRTSKPSTAGPRALDSSQCNKRIRQVISSMSVHKNVNHTKQCVVPTKQVPHRDVSEPRRLQNFVLSANVRGMEVYGVKFSRTRPYSRNAQCKHASNPSLSPSSDCHDEGPVTQPYQQTEEQIKSLSVTFNQQEHCSPSKTNPPFDTGQAINIPTALHLN